MHLKKIQSSYFKKVFIIMLRKSKKKNYAKFLSYKLIALLDTLSKMLKLIVFDYIKYVVKTSKTFSQITFNKFDFIIYNKKDLHNIK